MTGPRNPTVHPQRRRARHLLPFLLAIVLSPLACTSDQPTAPDSQPSGPSAASGRPHPYLASRAALARGPAMALARTSGSMAAAVSPPGDGPKVLILADVDGASTTALANSIVDAGFHVGIKRAPEYNWSGSNPSLDGYDVVIHLNGLTYDLPLAPNAQDALKAFVSNGGGFVGAQWNGYEEVSGQQTGMSELVLQSANTEQAESCAQCEVTYSAVSGQEGHPVLAGLPSSFAIYADGHDASPKAGNDPSAVVLARVVPTINPDLPGGPAVLTSQYGSGKAVNFSFAPNYADNQVDRHTLEDRNVQQLYINAVRWLSGSAGIEGGGTLDSDADAILDGNDNCINTENPDQLDGDSDGLGDACDSDADGDGVPNDEDNCELYNPDQADVNQNYIGDVCEEVQTLPQFIIFNPLLDRTILQSPLVLDVRASSGLEVTFLASGTCTVDGSSVTLTAIGMCTIIAQQGGNAEYSPAPTLDRSFNITKAPATMSVGTEYTFDGTVKQATITTSPAALNGVTVTYTLNGSTVPSPVNAGVYQVAATLDNPIYEAPPASGTLTIHPAVPVIQWAAPAAITAGTPLSSTQLNATATGVGGISLLRDFTYAPAEGTVLAAGTRPLSVEFASPDGNYTRVIKTVMITVLPAPVPPPATMLKFKGFFRPVHNLPAVNRMTAGRAILVMFSVEGSRGPALQGSPTSVAVACSASMPERSVEEHINASSSRMLVVGSRYTYIWKTSSTWAGTCRKLVVTLKDGSTHAAMFHFRKKSTGGGQERRGDDDDRGAGDHGKDDRHEGKDDKGRNDGNHGQKGQKRDSRH